MSLVEDLHGISDLDSALVRVLEHFGGDGGTIHLLDGNGMLALQAASAGMPEPVLDAIRMIPPGKGMAGIALERNEPVDTCNLQADDSGGAIRPGAKATGFGGSITVPIRDQEGNPIGTLGIATVAERSFTPDETDELMRCGEAIGWSS